MLWVYLVWVIVLLGAVIAAYAPTLGVRIAPGIHGAGGRFHLAVGALGVLEAARHTDRHGLPLPELAAALRADPLQVDAVVETLAGFGWVARLDEEGQQRYVLLADPAITRAEPLLDALLLQPTAVSQPFRQRAGVPTMTLRELIG